MFDFENFLLSIGYIRLHYKNEEWVPCDTPDPYYSTLGNVSFIYKKDTQEICFGLHEKGLPPTLIYPRPNGVVTDNEMNRILQENTPQQVIDLIF